MKKVTLIIMLAMVMVITACNWPDLDELTVIEGPVAEESKSFVVSYKVAMVEAVNTGSFNLIEPYLIINNNFYNSLKSYVDDLYNVHVTKELKTFDVKTVYVDELDEIYVDVQEAVLIHEKDGVELVERNVQIHLYRNEDDSLQIANIIEMK